LLPLTSGANGNSAFWTVFGRRFHTIEIVMDASDSRNQSLFIVRIWKESGRDKEAWRGSVEHIATGQRLYFTSLNDLNDFIQFKVEAEGSDPAPKLGPAILNQLKKTGE
jgi:hypothetical protein